jgi:hypothetical protein
VHASLRAHLRLRTRPRHSFSATATRVPPPPAHPPSPLVSRPRHSCPALATRVPPQPLVSRPRASCSATACAPALAPRIPSATARTQLLAGCTDLLPTRGHRTSPPAHPPSPLVFRHRLCTRPRASCSATACAPATAPRVPPPRARNCLPSHTSRSVSSHRPCAARNGGFGFRVQGLGGLGFRWFRV